VSGESPRDHQAPPAKAPGAVVQHGDCGRTARPGPRSRCSGGADKIATDKTSHTSASPLSWLTSRVGDGSFLWSADSRVVVADGGYLQKLVDDEAPFGARCKRSPTRPARSSRTPRSGTSSASRRPSARRSADGTLAPNGRRRRARCLATACLGGGRLRPPRPHQNEPVADDRDGSRTAAKWMLEDWER
jgi:hypothetical protein